MSYEDGVRALDPSNASSAPALQMQEATDGETAETGTSRDVAATDSQDADADTGSGEIPQDVADVFASWPNGIAVSFYADHEATGYKDDGNGREIKKKAIDQSGLIGAVQLVGGQLKLGGTHPVTHRDQVAPILEAICARLDMYADGVDRALDRAKVRQLHLYAHGWRVGGDQGDEGDKEDPDKGLGTTIDLGARDGTGSLGLSDLEEWTKAVSSCLTSDVNIAMFACNTGGARDADPQGGEGSLADKMRDSLYEQGHTDAMVMSHFDPGHTSSNSKKRIFGGEVGGYETDVGGTNFLDLAFDAEIRETYQQESGKSDSDVKSDLKDFLQGYLKHWRVQDKPERRYVGYVIMVDPIYGAELIREAWNARSHLEDYSYQVEIDYDRLGRGTPNMIIVE